MNTKTLGLKWDVSQGWFNCVKMNPDRSHDVNIFLYDDSEMCWVATASNMLHWWMEQNKEYIKRFDPQAKIPQKYHDALHSDIFVHFKKSFANTGGWEDAACTWFIGGVGRPAGYQNPNLGNGFFKDFFDTNATSAIVKRGLVRDVGDLLKIAFEEGEEPYAVGFSAHSGASHAMTIWGCAFDDSGNPTHVFICDNNTRGNIFYDDNTPIDRPMILGKECPAGMWPCRLKNEGVNGLLHCLMDGKSFGIL